jgi:hypothetical protein
MNRTAITFFAVLAASLDAACAANLTLREHSASNTISVHRDNVPQPILTQNARPDFRPYLHPIVAPDDTTVLTAFEVKLAAVEPMITQPMAFCWDDRGRLWVAENRDYETRTKGFSADGNSRILILEDTNGDGPFDTRKAFLDGIPFPSAIAVGFGGLWLGAPPNLLFVPDRNHDDHADGPLKVRLSGWGIQDQHAVYNSFSWGLDFDDHSPMFITACIIPHLWHVIPGGIYHRQGGSHINPYVFDDIKTIANHSHRSAHDNAWVGFSMEIGPDSAAYMFDWHDIDICGNAIHDKDTGRIYRLAPKGLQGKQGITLAAQTDLALRLQLLEGVRDRVKSPGRNVVTKPKNWDDALAALDATRNAKLTDFTAQIGQLFGDTKAAAAQLAVLKDPVAPIERRRQILTAFARDAYAAALPVVLSLLDEPAVRRGAIRALASFDDPQAAATLIHPYSRLSAAEKSEVVSALSARRSTASALVAELKKNTIPKTDVTAFDARQIYRVLGPSFVDEVRDLIAYLRTNKQAPLKKQ